MSEIAIMGTTSWGETLGVVFAGNGRRVSLWARTEAEASEIRDGRPWRGQLPAAVPPGLTATASLSDALDGAAALILAVPSQTMRQNIRLAREYLTESMLVISAAKGFELKTNKRMSQVIAEEIAPEFHANICVLSGPNLSREIIQGLPAATVVAAASEAKAVKAQRLLSTNNFCVYTNTDVVGVELGGALKNIIALGAGMVEGLGFGDNTKAAFVTRGLIEIAALGVALGASPLTFTGLTGLGDTIATCASHLSRNHQVGLELAKGRSLQEIGASLVGIAEGVNTTVAARALSREHGLGMPVTEKIYQVLFEGADPRQVVAEITSSEASHELAGQNWEFSSFYKNPPSD
ncbi:NAD(P)H-dependent glycerol-3-phosphate dehydrogenase [Chloroflexota bacterium]